MKQIYLTAALLAALAAAGCETSNQDYSSSNVQVVDVTARPTSSQPTTTAGPAAVYQNGSSAPVYTSNSTGSAALEPLSADTAVSSQPVITYAEPLPADQSVVSAAPVSSEPVAAAAPASSTSGAGVVMPYVPDQAAASGDTYTVVKGDTLYSIAFRYGLDFRALAKQNGIEPPYNIAVGQVIRLNTKASAAPTYTVQKGDTLYSIAKKHGQSVAFLAGVNNLTAPYTLSSGQVLVLSRQSSATTANRQSTQASVPVAGQTAAVTTAAATSSKTSTSASSRTSSKSTTASSSSTAADSSTVSTTTVVAKNPVIVSGSTRKVSGVTWMWPAKGSVIESFSLSEQGNKGIDIGGTRGQQILAAADGQVVYAGNALRGYGNLIIINHANEFLSAYAHNDVLLVTEGQTVKRGQQIARMGSTDAKSVRLHFEIRYRGQSVNPVNYLPK